MDTIKVNATIKNVSFWKAMKIYHEHPKCINKEVLFSEDVLISQLLSSLTLSECQKLFNNICIKLSKKHTVDEDFAEFKHVDVENVFLLPERMYVIIRKLIPKSRIGDNFDFFEIIFLDKVESKAYIFTKNILKTSVNFVKTKNLDPFTLLKFNFIQLTWGDNCVEISHNKCLSERGKTWLHATFAPKFRKLLLNNDLSNNQNKNSSKLVIDSRIDIVQYYKLYEKMKLKYANYFVENWMENTDPKKFVYEDIGIASYLLMLWNRGNISENHFKPQKFIDLGCGNGLLVHILNSEGHFGIGLDIRKRKIWDTYPATTVLKEEIINPTSKTTFPEADWMIGNHSDELTAWIPIMARLSNNHCQYFVLPCCPYQLNGMKFQRKNSGLSCYQDFIKYVNQISQLCGFETYVDKLRIPSTKRICLVGLNESRISEEKYSVLKEEIDKFIRNELQGLDHQIISNGNLEKHSLNFKIRESVQLVRNCTKLPQDCIDNILLSIMNELLKKQNVFTVIKDKKSFCWNRGKKISVGELASCLNKSLLQQLKKECKGLQTLLKNHHFLFEVSEGFVQFRSPENMLKLSEKFLDSEGTQKWKLKKCWFFYNHPDKCPLNDSVCSYSHDNKNTQI